ncbi:hypothetical protein J7K50_05265 [bacterium]|nr:hypothetical protein [bacterium]
MTITGYIRLASKVLFDDPDAIILKGTAEPTGTPLVENRGTVAPDSQPAEAEESIRQRREPDVPVYYIARCMNRKYTGELGGVWFEDGEATVDLKTALRLEEMGCRIRPAAGVEAVAAGL